MKKLKAENNFRARLEGWASTSRDPGGRHGPPGTPDHIGAPIHPVFGTDQEVVDQLKPGRKGVGPPADATVGTPRRGDDGFVLVIRPEIRPPASQVKPVVPLILGVDTAPPKGGGAPRWTVGGAIRAQARIESQ